MKVLGIGEIVLDKTILLDSYPAEDSKVQPKKVTFSLGGPVPAALILLSRLGQDCKLVCSVGDDDAGAKLKTILKQDNVQLLPQKQKMTKVNTILTSQANGSRTIIRSEVRHSQLQAISAELIHEADMILFDRHEPKLFEYVLLHKRPETRIIVDPSTEVSNKTIKMLQSAHTPIVPIEYVQKYCRHDDMQTSLRKLYEAFGQTLVITAGEYGSLVYDGQELKIFPSFDIQSVDALGAGDIYRGAFSYGLMQQWEIERIVEYSNAVAALQCTRVGNNTAIPTKREIEEFMQTASKRIVQLEQVLARYW